jgi:hypothetical protein
MPSSRILIESQTLGSAAASVTFSSIPATYTDLVLRYSARVTSGTVENIQTTLNSSGSGFSETYLYGTGSAAVSGAGSAQSVLYAIYVNGGSTTASTFTNGEFYIPSYTASQNKCFNITGGLENNATLGRIFTTAALWSNTAAVTSIKLEPFNSFVTGSSFYLYGLRSS